MADGEPIAFTRGAADRIAAAVRTVEVGSRGGGGIEWDTQPPQVAKVFRVCTFTGAWFKETQKTVTFRSVTTTPNTVTAYNIFANVGRSGQNNCAIAKDGTAWYMIAAEC